MPDTCPGCGQEVLLTSVHNVRNDKWTVLPLDPDDGKVGDFTVDAEHTVPAVDILGQVVGAYNIATYKPEQGTHRPHPPSHYLGHDHSTEPNEGGAH